jgi:hypothetical protein
MSDIDNLFSRLRPSRFLDTGVNSVPQEVPAGYDRIEPTGFIAPGVVDVANFATTIIAPRVVTSLPALPDTNWPQGTIVFLTTDQKLYRNTTGSAWSRATDGADIIADSITAGQIAAAAIGTDELAATSVTAAKIAANTITAGEIAASAIGTEELAATSVTAAKLQIGHTSNIITNPDFEFGTVGVDDVIPGWTTVQRAGGTIYIGNFANDAVNPVQGTKFLVIRNGTSIIDAGVQQGPFPATVQERISVSAYGQGFGSTGHLQFYMQCFDKGGSSLGYVIGTDFNVGNSAGWNRVSDTLTPLANTVSVTVGVQNHGAVLTYLGVDDILVLRSIDGVNAASGAVLINNDGITVTNGKITVKNASATVIIDGTSNMFKIQASGSQSKTQADNSQGTASTTLTGLGTLSATPAHLSYVAIGNTNADTQRISPSHMTTSLFRVFVATTSGGSPTTPVWGVSEGLEVKTNLNASSQCVVSFTYANQSGASATTYSTYYILKEAAL